MRSASPRPPASPLWLALASLLCLAGLLIGCGSHEYTPELLGLLDVGPRVVSTGEAIEIVGTSLPVRKTARVTLSGSLHRPGQESEEGFELDAEGQVSGERVSLLIDDALLARFCGGADVAEHATFRGEVQVSFPAATPGALPVTGIMRDIVIDIRPPEPRRARREEQSSEADRVLSLIGVRIAADAERGGGGLQVTEVMAGSAAEEAGLKAGDALVSLDGWTLLDKRDLLPSGRRRTATMGVLRGSDRQRIELEIALRGYKPGGSTELLWVAVLLGTAACAILFFASPLSRVLGWLDRFAARAAIAHAGRRNIIVWLLSCLWAFWRGDAAHAGSDVLPYIVFLVASALCSILPFGKQIIGVEPDAGTVLLLPVLLSAVVALGQGEDPEKKRWSPLRGLRLSAWTLLYHVPSSVAVGCTLMLSGSILLSDIVRSQGGEPWQWAALRTPAGLPMMLLFFAPVLLDRAPPAARLPDAEPSALANLTSRAKTSGLASALSWGSTFMLCGLGASLFLGGWALPFVERSTQERSFWLQAIGALLFLLKTWGLALGIAVVRETLPRIRIDQTGSPFLRWLLPLSLAVSGLTAGWLMWDPAPVLRKAIALVGTLLVTLLVVHIVRRLSTVVRSAGAQPHVSPFL